MWTKRCETENTRFIEKIKPLMQSPWVEFIGEIGDHEKNDFLGNALACLFPIDWPEPFGLVMIEAMACGTPTIAFRNGQGMILTQFHGAEAETVLPEVGFNPIYQQITFVPRKKAGHEFHHA